MGAARVLLVGRIQPNQLVNVLQKRYQVLLASSGKTAVSIAQEHAPQIIILDAASMRTPGDRICQSLRQSLEDIPIIHIHPGPKETVQSSAEVVLFPPLTSRKLLNAIDRTLQVHDDETIEQGPFSVNLVRRILNIRGQEIQLTPKQALLMETFMRHPGEVLDRKLLMEKVWQTDYLGDTRTLDVHIRWIREAIEENPSQPRFLITVRGVGYRLDLPAEPLAVEVEQAVFELG